MDNIEREREARDQMARLSGDVAHWAGERRAALWALKEELGTWPKVAAATNQTVSAITKAAYKRPQEGTS